MNFATIFASMILVLHRAYDSAAWANALALREDPEAWWMEDALRQAIEVSQGAPACGTWLEASFNDPQDAPADVEERYRFLDLTGENPVLEHWNWESGDAARLELKINYEDLEVLFGEGRLSTREQWVDDEDDRALFSAPWTVKTAFISRDNEQVKVETWHGESLELPLDQARAIFKPQVRRLLKEHFTAALKGRGTGLGTTALFSILDFLGVKYNREALMGPDGETLWGDHIEWGLLPQLS